MNKGLEIRNKKLRKNTIKRNTVKPEQENTCQFVSISYEIIDRVNGKYKHLGSKQAQGLQVKNRVYLTTGGYKLINSKNAKVKKKFEDIPEWATEELICKYKKFHGITE